MSTPVSLGVGQRVQVSMSFQDGAHNPVPDEPITWVSDTPSVATVPGSGNIVQITAVAVGTANITATSGALTQVIVVTVVAVYPTYMNLTVGTPTGP